MCLGPALGDRSLTVVFFKISKRSKSARLAIFVPRLGEALDSACPCRCILASTLKFLALFVEPLHNAASASSLGARC